MTRPLRRRRLRVNRRNRRFPLTIRGVSVTSRSLVLVTVVSALTVPGVSRAQQAPPPRVRREIRGFDFRKDGVWRRQARAVRALRARLLSRRNFGALNAPMAVAGAPLASGAAVSGVLRVPALLFKFKNTPAGELRTMTQYDQVLFAASPTGASAGRRTTTSGRTAASSWTLLAGRARTQPIPLTARACASGSRTTSSRAG